MQESNQVTALIIAYNESQRISQTIKHLLPHVAEVVVGDTGSTDETMAIATEAGARVVQINWHNDFARARNDLMLATTNEWCLFCDADEEFNDGFFYIMNKHLLRLDNIDLFYVWRISEFDGQVVGKEWQPRLLRRKGCVWTGTVHEGVSAKQDHANIPEMTGVMYHRHTMNRQRWNNLMYQRQKEGKERPSATRGAEERNGKWEEFDNSRNS